MRDGEGFAGACNTKEDLIAQALFHPLHKASNSRWLVAGGLEFGNDFQGLCFIDCWQFGHVMKIDFFRAMAKPWLAHLENLAL